jgi:ATP-dependent protease HslVU (ClpYQ) peptidase subunit
MTVILGLKKNNEIWLSADTRITANNSIADSAFTSKVLNLKNCFIAFSGNVMFRDYFELFSNERSFEFPEVFNSKLDVMKVFIKFWGFLKENEARIFGDDSESYTALVATATSLYEVDPDNTVTELSSFGAIGSGGLIASGVMDYLISKEEQPEIILQESHNVACKYDVSCGGDQEIFNVTRLLKGKRKYTKRVKE